MQPPEDRLFIYKIFGNVMNKALYKINRQIKKDVHF